MQQDWIVKITKEDGSERFIKPCQTLQEMQLWCEEFSSHGTGNVAVVIHRSEIASNN